MDDVELGYMARRLSGIRDLRSDQGIGMIFDSCGDSVEDSAPLDAVDSTPCSVEYVVRLVHSTVGEAYIGLVYPGCGLSGGRVDSSECPCPIHESTADVVLVLEHSITSCE
nr:MULTISPECIES: hypothetical protein [Rhodococcus]